ncbi:MAG: transketolase, partial [Myxococcales bacterium]|nr:transketolase [Myxococcales bacterium]
MSPASDARENLDLECINTIRTLAIDAVQKANSGHPGLPLGAAPMAYALWQHHLKHNPSDPKWPDRDRFVLSAGHGSMLQYALLHLTGYDLSLDDLRNFRQWGSKTPGHPEFLECPGVEATTGPLGQGTANAFGMAIAERALAHRFNRPGHAIVDHFTYALVSDGDLMEGLSAEVGSLAGHLKLGKLIYLYDANDISLDGPTSMSFTEDVGRRYEAYGWQVQLVEKGDTDVAAIDDAIAAAKADTARPSLIIVKTTIGYGSPNKSGSSASHGSPLGADEVKLTKKALGWDPNRDFYVPERAAAHMNARERGTAHQSAWRRHFEAYEKAHPDLAAQWKRAFGGRAPAGWDKDTPTWSPKDKDGKAVSLATRVAVSQAINATADGIPCMIGGDADLSCSTGAVYKKSEIFNGQTGAGRNIAFGVREHAMAAATNGILYHGGARAFTSTFFCFADYMRPSLRLAAMNRLPAIYVWTHDSIGVGEDGPTHQPIEHLMSLRAIPNLWMIRPGDANEAAEAWRVAVERTDGPTGLVLSRQNLPVADRAQVAPAQGLRRGAYVLADGPNGKFDAILIATGSEVPLAMATRDLLAKSGVGVRVVSMPCW